MDALRGYLERYVPMINKRLDEVSRGWPQSLYEAARHLLLAGGKRVRPALSLLYARMLGGEPAEAKALDFAVAVELIHNFTLIHDDIMDKDEYRRGVPTVHKKYGENMAILAGDLLFALAFEAAARNTYVAAANKAKALELLASATRIVAEGQALDIGFENRWNVSLDDYLEMVYRKTGALIEASTGIGALSVTLNEDIVSRARIYGRNIGIAFQIRDDIIGTFGDPAVTGKPVYNDLARAKKTVLVIYAISNLPPSKAEKLVSILNMKPSDKDLLEEAASLIKDSGALEYASSLAWKYVDEAIKSVEETVAIDEDAKKALIEFARYIVEREK